MDVPETGENLQSIIETLRRWLVQADPYTFGLQMARLFEFARSFGINVPNETSALKIYRATLEVLPPDLLTLAITRTVETWKWGNRLPLPADVRAMVSEELIRRRLDLTKAQTAQRKLFRKPSKNEEPIGPLPEFLRDLLLAGKVPPLTEREAEWLRNAKAAEIL